MNFLSDSLLGGVVLPWPHHRFVFVFFFASLLGIALARAEEVGQRHGGSQSPFGLGWLATLAIASLALLLLAASVAALLTGENISRFLSPVLDVLYVISISVAYVLSWIVHIVVTALQFLFRGIGLEDFLRSLAPLAPLEWETRPRQSLLTAEQLGLARAVGVVLGVLFLLLLVAFSLRRLRARAGRRRTEERESVWEGAHLSRAWRNLLRRGRRQLDKAVGALGHSRLGRLFAAMTIRRIYAHVSALAEQGYPHASYETPYEYLPALEQAFPESHAEVAHITGAYVAVHYGEVPEHPEDLEAILTAWERVREMAVAGSH